MGLLALLIGNLVGSPTRTDSWLYHWQTLITGALALLGAVATVWVILRQIGQADKLHEEGWRRESLAARGVLAVALNAITDYAVASLTELVKLHKLHRDGRAIPIPEFPPLPAEIIEPFRLAIRAAEPDKAEELTQVLGMLQIHNAHLRDIAESIRSTGGPRYFRGPADLTRCAVGAAKLYAAASNLFAYARPWEPDRGHRTTPRGVLVRLGLQPHEWKDLHRDLGG